MTYDGEHVSCVPNCPISAGTSMCGHLVVDSGELGQPDVASGLKGMAREPTYINDPAGRILLSGRFWCWIINFVSPRATLRVPRSLGD